MQDFQERLINAIQNNDSLTVRNILDALQYIYDNHKAEDQKFLKHFFISPMKRVKSDESETFLYFLALNKNIEIFKDLILFYKKNSLLEIYQDFVTVMLAQIFYHIVLDKNFAATSFLVEEIKVDLTQPSKGFPYTWGSPLIAAYNNIEIFKYLFIPTIYALEVANKSIDEFLDQVKEFLQKIRHEPKFKSDNDEVEKAIKLITCYKLISVIFKKCDLITLYSNLSKSYENSPIDTLNIICQYIESIAAETNLKPEYSTPDYIRFLSEMIKMISSLIKTESTDLNLHNTLNTIYKTQIFPGYFAIASQNDERNPEVTDVITYLHEIPSFHVMTAAPKNAINNVKLVHISTKNEQNQLDSIKPKILPPKPEIILETAKILLEKRYYAKAANALVDLALNGNKESIELLCTQFEEASKEVGIAVNYNLGLIFKKNSDLDLTIKYWSKTMDMINNFKSLTTTVAYTRLKEDLNGLIRNQNINLSYRKEAWKIFFNNQIQYREESAITDLLQYGMTNFSEDINKLISAAFKIAQGKMTAEEILLFLKKVESCEGNILILINENPKLENIFINAIMNDKYHIQDTHRVTYLNHFNEKFKKGNFNYYKILMKLIQKSDPIFDDLLFDIANTLIQKDSNKYLSEIIDTLSYGALHLNEKCIEQLDKLFSQIYNGCHFTNNNKLIKDKLFKAYSSVIYMHGGTNNKTILKIKQSWLERCSHLDKNQPIQYLIQDDIYIRNSLKKIESLKIQLIPCLRKAMDLYTTMLETNHKKPYLLSHYFNKNWKLACEKLNFTMEFSSKIIEIIESFLSFNTTPEVTKVILKKPEDNTTIEYCIESYDDITLLIQFYIQYFSNDEIVSNFIKIFQDYISSTDKGNQNNLTL